MKIKPFPFLLIGIIFFSAFVSILPLHISNASSGIIVQTSFSTSYLQTSLTMSKPITSGNTLVVFVTGWSSTYVSASISDTRSNAFTSISSSTGACTDGAENIYTWYSNITSSGSDTISITTTTNIIQISAFEIFGENQWSFAYGSGCGGSSFYTSGINVVSNDVVIAQIGSNSVNSAFVNSSGYLSNGISPSGTGAMTEWRIPSSGSLDTAPFTGSIFSPNYPWIELEIASKNPIFPSITTTYTQTITGWVFPNFIDGTGNISWFYMLGIMLFPVGFIAEIAYKQNNGILNLDSKSPIFLTLVSLFIGSLIGTFTNFVPIVFPLLTGIILAVYIWRGS